MKIAIISYDADFLSKLQDLIKDADYRNYIDSISLLNEFHLFSPDAVIYDASSGIFAEEDLKFLSEKEEFKTIPLFVGISKENPINTEGFPQNFKFFTKEDDNQLKEIINEIANSKIKQEIKSESQTNVEDDFLAEYMEISEKLTLEEPKKQITSLEEELFGEITENKPKIESDFISQVEIEPTSLISEEEDIKTQPKVEDITPQVESPIEVKEEIVKTAPIIEQKPIADTTTTETVIKQEKPEEKQETKPKTYFISISLTEEDIKAIIKEQISEFIKNDESMVKILDHLQIDFVNDMNTELNALKTEIKESLKEKYKNSLEEEIQTFIKTELKKDIKELAEKIAREKLEQVFSKLF